MIMHATKYIMRLDFNPYHHDTTDYRRFWQRRRTNWQIETGKLIKVALNHTPHIKIYDQHIFLFNNVFFPIYVQSLGKRRVV